jgi:hypothetical protein
MRSLILVALLKRKNTMLPLQPFLFLSLLSKFVAV